MKMQKDIIFILGSLLIVTIVWIAFTIQHNAQQSTISEPLNQDIIGITPDFNTAVIAKLKDRQLVDPSYSYSSAETLTATDTATPTPSVTLPTPSPTITPTPSTVEETITNTP